MIVIHAIWEINSGLHLWGESSSLLSNGFHAEKGRKKPSSHPFAVSHDSLRKLGDVSGYLSLTNVIAGNAVAFLPSTEGLPVPSKDLLACGFGERSKTNKIRLMPWHIDTITLAPDTTLDFLSSLPARALDGVVFGDSLRFWIETAKLSLELISRQCFLPSTIQEEVNGKPLFKTFWRPIIEGKDQERLLLLNNSMPPCCLAIQSPDEKKPSPSSATANFLERTIDVFIRKNLSLQLIQKPKAMPRNIGSSQPWLHALFSKDNQLKQPKEKLHRRELESLVSALDSWLSTAAPVGSDAPLHACFRLESPSKASSGWKLSFNLQASDDPSLLIPAENIWRVKSSVITFLKRRFESPQERLLADLGKASRIFMPIEESLKTACPTEVELNTENAYLFLSQSASILEQSGFGVLIPSWWQKPSERLGAKLKLKPKQKTKNIGSGLMGFDAIVKYEWQVAIGESVLSQEEFEKLANLKIPLVKVRGQWIEFKPEEIEKAIYFFNKKCKLGEIKLVDALRLAIGQDISETGLSVTGVESEGWIKELMDTFPNEAAKMPIVKPPEKFKGQLRPYQISGVSWMAFLKRFGLGACLADDMGLGKTIEFIAFLLHLQDQTVLHGPSLLICPMSVVNNWRLEVQRFAPTFKVMVHHGTARSYADKFVQEAEAHDIVITTYNLAHHDEEALTKVKWECIVLDEAQNIKNSSAKQSQAVRKLKSNYRIALTGTPVENRLSELWSIMEFLNPGYLRTAEDFHRNFVIPIEKFHNPAQTERLKRLIQPFVLRRVKTDPTIITDLPEKIETKVFCNLSQEQATLYEAVVKEMLGKIEGSEGIERKGLVLSTILRLKQVCNHPAQFLQDKSTLPKRSGKLIRLEEMLEEVLDEGDKALIFTQFAEMGKMIKKQLQDTFSREVLFLHGGIPRKERDAMIQRFQNKVNGPSLFVLSLKAGGLGLNLTAANHVFHYDRWWNPAVENQATDRAFRIGQRKNVQVHKFVCLGTMEEHIDQMIEQKKALAQSVVGTGEAWLTEMSNEQLREVFKLNRDAVAN